MSFADKISSLMSRPGPDGVEKDDVPWWMRYAGRGVGTIGGFIAIFLGAWNCTGIITININSLLSGIFQMLAGFVLICVEAPCCCLFVDYVQNLSDWVEKRPYWNKALAYVILSIPAIAIYSNLASIFGSGLIFVTGVLYGLMALGKKASPEEMRAAAAAADMPPSTRPTSMRSNLVANAQPISFTGPPLTDSNV